MDRDYKNVANYLKSLKLHFLDSWLKECVDYYKTNDRSLSLESLKTEVLQQWLLVNLRDLKVPCFPSNLSELHNIVLPDTYTVQVEEMYDASKPCFTELLKLKKISTDNVNHTVAPSNNWEPKSSRCLMLSVTDGIQDVKAMEYKPIHSLKLQNSEMVPGFKMQIIGPVTCRKGVILLKNENVKILGGEVDSLICVNALENILSRRLDLEENSNPTVSDTVSNNETDETCRPAPPVSNDYGVHVNDFEDDFDPDLISDTPENNINEPIFQQNIPAVVRSDTPMSIPEFNDDYTEVTKCQEPFRKIQEPENNFPSDEDSYQEYSNLNSKAINQQTTYKASVQSSQDIQLTQVSFDYDSDFESQEPVPPKPTPAKMVNSEPFIYLKQVVNLSHTAAVTYKVKAQIFTLKTKLSLKNEQFSLLANITDGTCSIDVDFSSDVLESILGFSPCEMTTMVKQRSSNPAIGTRIKSSFDHALQKLIDLNCIMHIKFNVNTTPEVIELEEINSRHVQELRNRSIPN